MPTPPNGQTHSNNLSAAADKLLSVFKPFLGSWRLKGNLIFARSGVCLTIMEIFKWKQFSNIKLSGCYCLLIFGLVILFLTQPEYRQQWKKQCAKSV